MKRLRAGMASDSAQGGAVLVYVLGILVLLGLLTGLFWRLVAQNEDLALKRMRRGQVLALAHSGLDYARHHLEGRTATALGDFALRDLLYRLDSDRRAFRLDLETHGLFARARATGVLKAPAETLGLSLSAVFGQALEAARFPAVGLLNREGNLVLAGTAEIRGPVLLWRGGVRKASHTKVRWQGGAGHAGPLWDSTAGIWPGLQADFRSAGEWMDAADAAIAGQGVPDDAIPGRGAVPDDAPGPMGIRPAQVGEDAAGPTAIRLAPDASLEDTLLSRVLLVCPGLLRIGEGARLENCRVWAREVAIEGGARLRHCLVYAARRLEARGEARLQGQFLARESLLVDLEDEQREFPVFYVHGRLYPGASGDSLYRGGLEVRRYRGEGHFLAAARDRPAHATGVQIGIGRAAQLRGLVFTPGLARMEGELEGTLVCGNFRFEHKGTIWLGHLKDARIRSAPAGSVFPVPILFPGLKPRLIRREPL